MILRLTDGTTTINLTGGSDIRLAAPYMPQAPRGEGDVSESVQVTIVGATTTAVEALVRSIEGLLRQGVEYQRAKVANRVWVEFRWGDSGTVYRAELKDGRIEPDRTTGTKGHRADTAIQALVAWQRAPYWEGAEERLNLANDYAYVAGASGLAISNHNDQTNTTATGEVIETADGSKTYGGTFAHIPVKRSSVTITYTIGGAAHTATDDGYGVLAGEHGAIGTIDYVTGVWALTFLDDDAAVTGETIDTGDGATEAFSGALDNDNIVSGTLRLRYTQGGTPGVSNYDSGSNIVGPAPFRVGVIAYATGTWNTQYDFEFGFPPDNLTPILAEYHYYLYRPDASTNITATYTYLSAGHLNYVDVLANDVDGVLPCAAILQVQNTTGAAAYNFFIGHNVFCVPASMNPILEAVGSADANCSGGDVSRDCADGGGGEVGCVVFVSGR